MAKPLVLPDPRAFLQAENARLKQHGAQLEQVIANRSVTAVGEFIDGLQFVLNGAASGDSSSMVMVGKLKELLTAVELKGRILLP